MIFIYQADSSPLKLGNKVEKLLQELPKCLHERALRYKFEEDALNFILGRLLLKKGLEKLGLGDQLEQVAYHKNGKPYLPTVAFNISHTKNKVVCALSTDGRVGIDIEKEKVIGLEDFKTWWYSEKEWGDITAAEHTSQKFYWYWTRKESIIKALGVTLAYLHEIELDPTKDFFIENEKQWHLRDLDFGEGYYGAICSEVDIGEVKWV